ncbi:hypothetical protein [Saccharibacillus kuerlensis]|uniref:Uncharacterized protein n=1 Tax=Saccharibacillus kuerlensis TaxID=459527 RepID=A0ABQ2LAD5_9BACL|nr:hypothetical protein [Saccharibacillus kuerlensis]GGO08416.1 hypothetical protein GCM10010969_37880 [Saccharibacillus kuerlensis]
MKISKGRRVLITLAATTLIFAGIVWSSKTEVLGGVVRVTEVRGQQIVVEDQSGTSQVLQLPIDMNKLITQDQEYVVHYNKKRWGEPELTNIEPHPSLDIES